VRFHKNFLAHDEKEECVVGDYVKIQSCKKRSKRKSFALSEIIKPAQRFVDSNGTLHTFGEKVKSIPKEYEMDKYL
jgi:small subunit ribosomal protein S17